MSQTEAVDTPPTAETEAKDTWAAPSQSDDGDDSDAQAGAKKDEASGSGSDSGGDTDAKAVTASEATPEPPGVAEAEAEVDDDDGGEVGASASASASAVSSPSKQKKTAQQAAGVVKASGTHKPERYRPKRHKLSLKDDLRFSLSEGRTKGIITLAGVPRSSLAMQDQFEQDATEFIAEVARQVTALVQHDKGTKTVTAAYTKYVLSRMGNPIYADK